MMDKDKWPVHERHCCPKHGCKYGDEDCPVVNGETDKHNEHCEMCEDNFNDPDPITLLLAWRKFQRPVFGQDFIDLWYIHELEMIKEIMDSPSAVAKSGSIRCI